MKINLNKTLIILSLTLCNICLGLPTNPEQTYLKQMKSGKIVSISEVDSTEGKNPLQSLDIFVGGFSEHNCRKALRPISRYEQYKDKIGFVEESNYQDDTQTVDFILNHILMPFRMRMVFNIPRIRKPGNYPFTFLVGFMKGLKGTITTKEVDKKCLIYVKANWKGKKTKASDSVLRIFTSTVGRLGLRKLLLMAKAS